MTRKGRVAVVLSLVTRLFFCLEHNWGWPFFIKRR
jgi:hypothetical protein